MPKILSALLALIYPQECRVCGGSVEDLYDGVACRECWSRTRVFAGGETICHKCGRFLSEKPSEFQTFCHQCDWHFYDHARAAGLYEKALQVSVINLKTEPFAAGHLKKLLVSAFERGDFQNMSKIVPIPLSRKRFIERGFNQAEILAQALAKATGVELDAKSLARVAHTPMHRAGMDTKARETTVKNAFEVKRPNFIKDKEILLIDDVFTSGATASACAKVLKESGAAKVYVLTAARAF